MIAERRNETGRQQEQGSLRIHKGFCSNGKHSGEVKRVTRIALQVIGRSLKDNIWASSFDFKGMYCKAKGEGAKLIAHAGSFSAPQHNKTISTA